MRKIRPVGVYGPESDREGRATTGTAAAAG